MDTEIPSASSQAQTHGFHQPFADRETQMSHQLSQTDERILSASHCQTDTEVPSVFSDGWTRKSLQPTQTAGSSQQPQHTGDGRKERAVKRPDIQTKGCGSSGIRTDAGTLPGPPRSRAGSPDRPALAAEVPPRGPFRLLWAATLARCGRRHREPRTDKGQRTDGRARWRRAPPGCATRAWAPGPRLGTGRARLGTASRRPRVPAFHYLKRLTCLPWIQPSA